jgi:hypothetical protein
MFDRLKAKLGKQIKYETVNLLINKSMAYNNMKSDDNFECASQGKLGYLKQKSSDI